MKYFKNAELARLYNISEKSVRNWIEGAREGKFALELYEQNGKVFIADTIKNETLLESFRDRAKKYRNSQSYKKLSPQPAFYEIYTEKQIIDIVTSIESYHEIPHQYLYQGPAAVSWSAYLHKLYSSPKGNILTNTVEALKHAQGYVMDLMSAHQRFNVVDLGVGNGLAAKDFVEHLLHTKKLYSYIGVDISPGLLDITRHNVESWFESQVTVHTYQKDLTHERFREIFTTPAEANILLFLGGTAKNFRYASQALHTIRDSMRPNDILVTSIKLDTSASRRFFDFSLTTEPLPTHDRQVLDLLSIEPKYYEIEQVFDEELRARHVGIKLKVDISIDISTPALKSTLHLEKGQSILLWRAWHWTAEDIIRVHAEAGFKMLQATKSKDEQCIVLVSKINTK